MDLMEVLIVVNTVVRDTNMSPNTKSSKCLSYFCLLIISIWYSYIEVCFGNELGWIRVAHRFTEER